MMPGCLNPCVHEHVVIVCVYICVKTSLDIIFISSTAALNVLSAMLVCGRFFFLANVYETKLKHECRFES